MRSAKGDAWYRLRTVKESSATSRTDNRWHNRYVYDPHPHDWSHIDEITSGHGRAHFVNDALKEQRLTTTIRWSESKIPNTGINALNSFYESSVPQNNIKSGFRDYDKDLGSIQKIVMRETDLIVIHEDKVGRVLIEKEVLSGLGSAGEIGSTRNVLSDEQPFEGDFGVFYNPESVTSFGNDIYFTDIKRGKVIKLGRAGIEKISDSQMRTYFNNKSIELF